jgi:hypothetical protein
MAGEFICCHGTPEAGHSRTCPYDKEFWGPEGVSFTRLVIANAARGINFHESTMANRHGEGSSYAKNFIPQGAVAGVETPKPAAKQKSPRVQSDSFQFE